MPYATAQHQGGVERDGERARIVAGHRSAAHASAVATERAMQQHYHVALIAADGVKLWTFAQTAVF